MKRPAPGIESVDFSLHNGRSIGVIDPRSWRSRWHVAEDLGKVFPDGEVTQPGIFQTAHGDVLAVRRPDSTTIRINPSGVRPDVGRSIAAMQAYREIVTMPVRTFNTRAVTGLDVRLSEEPKARGFDIGKARTSNGVRPVEGKRAQIVGRGWDFPAALASAALELSHIVPVSEVTTTVDADAIVASLTGGVVSLDEFFPFWAAATHLAMRGSKPDPVLAAEFLINYLPQPLDVAA